MLLNEWNPQKGAPIRLQVLALKNIGAEVPPRLKILLSDGQEALSCILSRAIMDSKSFEENCIVDVHEVLISGNSAKAYVVVVSMSLVNSPVQKIGNPLTIKVPKGTGQQGLQQSAYGAPQQQYQQHQAYGAPPPAAAVPQQQYQQHQAYGAPPPAAAAPQQQYQQHQAYGAPPPAAAAPQQQYQQHHTYGAPPPAAAPQQQYQQHQAYQYNNNNNDTNYRPAAGGVTARDESHVNLMPIDALNSYQNRWTVKARVTAKTPIKRYSNARGEGKFFSFDLLDEHDGEIRVVGWNEQCDRFFDQVEQGKVYYISKASLRNKRGNYNQTRHQFEIHLESGTQLELAPDTPSQTTGRRIKTVSFNFQPISSLEDAPANTTVDIIGIADTAADITTITRRDGGEVVKRSISVRDPSGSSIEVTLWGDFASAPGDRIAAEIAASRHPVVAIKGGRVGEFNGKNISTMASSQVLLNPDDAPETAQIQQWYQREGATSDAKQLSRANDGTRKADRRICMSQIRGEGLGLGNETAWVQAVCYIVYARNENFSYPACTLQYNGKQCNKKLSNSTGDVNNPDPNGWFCDRCNAKPMEPEHRYVLSCQLGDYTEATWVTAFNETGPSLLGVDAGQLVAWSRAQEDSPKFTGVFRDAQFKQFVVKLRLSEDKYQEESRLRVNVVRVDPISYKTETEWTLDAISRIERGEDAYPHQQGALKPVMAPQSHYNQGTSYGAPYQSAANNADHMAQYGHGLKFL